MKIIAIFIRENKFEIRLQQLSYLNLLLCGTPKGVNRIIDILHVLGFAKIVEGRPPLPSPISGEIMRILTRYFAE